MARTKGSKNIRKQSQPSAQFEQLDLVRKIIVYNYWLNIHTNGKEGWDHNKAGFVDHYSLSDYIAERVKKKSWYHLGRVS